MTRPADENPHRESRDKRRPPADQDAERRVDVEAHARIERRHLAAGQARGLALGR